MSARRTSSTQNPKLLLGTAAITALTTIGVSFIGIVPQLRSGDKQELAQLKKDFETFRDRAGVVGTSGSEATDDTQKTLIISGTVRSDDGARLLTGYDIYLLPEGNNLLAATTDDAGKFTFQGVPAGVYSIVVRDSSNGRSGKGLLDDASGEVQVIGAKVKYRIQH
jgi:hypothetical protein